MNCETSGAGDLAEQYVLGRLTEPDQTAFEEHFFVCGACLRDVQALQAAQLAQCAKVRKGMERPMLWAGIAAVLLVALGLEIAPRILRKAPELAQPVMQAAAPRVAAQPGSPAPSSPLLLLLARVEAPLYTPSTLRGASGKAEDQFRGAMKSYLAGDYGKAAVGLKTSLESDPGAAGPRFYLGVCELLTGQTGPAVDELRRVADMDETPYLEQARFFLAKGLLARQDVPGASRELELTIQLAGDRAHEARQLLDQLRAPPPSR